MSGGLMGSIIGAVLGGAGGALGAYAGFRRSTWPWERNSVARVVIVTVAAAALALIAGLYAPPAHRVAAMILLAVIAFVLNKRCAAAGREVAATSGEGAEKDAQKAETHGQQASGK